MTAEEMWRAFTAQYLPARSASYEAWAYGDDPDGLLALTLSGRKRATASALPLYRIGGEALPQAEDYSVLLDSHGNAACVLCNTAVRIVPFREVSEEFAALEGEGDLSLGYWRQVHEAFFTRALAAAGMTFTPDMPVVCEEFKVVYK